MWPDGYLCLMQARANAGRAILVLACSLVASLSSLAFLPDRAMAKPQEVRIRTESKLNFGTFMVFGDGSRAVSAAGAVTDTRIVALDGNLARPARFTIEYDRGNESQQVLDITIELVMSAPDSVRIGGVDARLSSFETTLPGHARVSSGEAMVIRLTNCRSRVCSTTFAVGGRLDVTRNFGGAMIDIPINIDARIVARDRQ